ncbi:MAG: hypothetical protein ACLFTK_16260 [Anaerolineales bacterium]
MNKFLFLGTTLLTITVMSACSPDGLLQSPQQQATTQARQTANVQTAAFSGTQVGTITALQATVDTAPIMSTQMAQLQQENDTLQLTLEAINNFGTGGRTPPPGVNTQDLAALVTPTAALLSNRNYRDLWTVPEIDPSTGCAFNNRRGRFGQDSTAIYATAVGENVVAGTVHQARWYYEDQLRLESQPWVADQDYGQVCIFFEIRPQTLNFTPGLWSVEFLVNGQPLLPIPFEICEPGEFC